ncbi:kinase-like domain-containing protein [Mycena amicta]|nr:kinase-like domain-containing protein [Mycena amicta]
MSAPHLRKFAKETEAIAVVLGNPPGHVAGLWTPVMELETDISDVRCETINTTPEIGYVDFVVGQTPNGVGTGAGISISFHPNEEILDCAENTALLTKEPFTQELIQRIADRVNPPTGHLVQCLFRTLPNGNFELLNCTIELLDPQQLSTNVSFPVVSIGNLIRTHKGPLVYRNYVQLVTLDESEYYVLKTTRHRPELLEAAEFMASLPECDLVLRPTHAVHDENGYFRGILVPYQPASSINDVLSQQLKAPLLWDLRLCWCTEIAGALAWLHTHAVWGDLKLNNIVLCRDGHCRLIDYHRTEAFTSAYRCPENETSAEGDVYSLGIVLWAIASVTPSIAPPFTFAPEASIPEWFSTLVDRCLVKNPALRPTASEVYDTLRAI